MKFARSSHIQRSGSVLTQFRSDPIAFLNKAIGSPSDTFQFRIAGRNLTLLKNAEQIDELLVKRQGSFKKGPGLLRLRRLLGDGLLTADGPRHIQVRRNLAPAFRSGKIAEYCVVMGGHASETTSEWRSGHAVDVHKEMARITLSVVSAALFRSKSPNPLTVGDGVAGALDAIYAPLSGCPHGRPGLSSSTRLLENALSEVTLHRAPAETVDDLLSCLAASGLSDIEKRDEALTFLLAGHESVATALTWTWFALSQHEAVRRRFEAEIDNSSADPDSLTYTRWIISESLRLYPPAWMFSREALEETTIGDTKYPAGSVLIAAPCVTHRDPRYWDNPDEFDPGRWSPANLEAKPAPRYAYFPFGGGARRCIGEQFALNELAIVLREIGRHWRLDRKESDPPPTFDPLVTLRPAGGLTMIPTRRK